jgi:hypothetical protein
VHGSLAVVLTNNLSDMPRESVVWAKGLALGKRCQKQRLIWVCRKTNTNVEVFARKVKFAAENLWKL